MASVSLSEIGLAEQRGITGPSSERKPEQSLADATIALGVFVASLLYLRLFYNYTLLNADEGIVLQGAERILRGQVLYRDFFSFYTPGSYYWTALCFKIFGSSILVGRSLLMVYGGLFAILTYLLARRTCSRWSALLAAYLVTITCLPYRFLTLHNWDSTLWAYGALYCAVWFLETQHWAWALGTGFLAALTCLFEQSKGAGVVLGLVAAFLLLSSGKQPRLRWKRRDVAALLVGFAGPFLVTIVYFGVSHGLHQMLAAWFWPLHHYSAVNRLPFGDLELSPTDRESLLAGSWAWRALILLVMGPCFYVPVLPVVAFGVCCYWAVKQLRGGSLGEEGGYYLLVSAVVMGLLLSAFATGRPDFTHLLYFAPLFFPVVAWIVDSRGIRSQLLASGRPLLALFFFVSSTAFGMALALKTLNAHSSLETRRGTLRASAPDEVLHYVEAHTLPGDKIFVYPYLPLYYYLTGTFSPTRYEYLQAGMHTPSQLREALSELDADRTAMVLYEPSFKEKIIPVFPSTPLSTLAAKDPVEEYIFAHYRPCVALSSATSWHFVLMTRKDLRCPESSELARQR